MDPLHITEFASKRYFEKIKQLKDAQVQDGQHAEASSVVTGQSSPFILPLRGSSIAEAEGPARASEQKRSEKSRFGFLSRNKSHPKSDLLSAHDRVDRRPSIAESTRQSLPFDQLFANLPSELQVEIIASLPITDILNLRRSSRALHALVSLNESPIVRHHLKQSVPAYAVRLYPAPQDVPPNFHYFCGLWHRLHVAVRLADLMCEWITKEIFLRTTAEMRAEFAPQRERMRRRLIPLLFTIFHFFEKYREMHLKYIEEHGAGLLREPYTINPIEAKIMDMYDDKTLLRVHQVFPLVISSFCRRLRPPSYVGRVERSIRGYLREKPADEVHVAILCIGGLRQVEKIWEVKGYSTRRAAVDAWYHGVSKDVVEPEAKKRRGVGFSLGRKKSLAAMGKGTGTEPIAFHHRSAYDSNSAGNWPLQPSLVFTNSLAAGMPMDGLSRDQLKTLLSDMPVLQKIWMESAEAIILDRKIVERSTDIKRNAQVMLELIREDNMDEEDQWWYDAAAPESARADLAAIQEEDADDLVL